MTQHVRAEEAVIAFEGTLDPMAASALRAHLRRASPGSVIVDFARVRDVHDVGIAVLAHGLAKDRVRVRFRGLSRHHERMLRYLGFEVAPLVPAAARTGADEHS